MDMDLDALEREIMMMQDAPDKKSQPSKSNAKPQPNKGRVNRILQHVRNTRYHSWR